MDLQDDGTSGLDRRTVLRRAAVTGGALVWAAPAVQTLASPAFASGSPLCRTKVDTGDCEITYRESPDCCACLEDAGPDATLAEALASCARQGRCVETLRVCGEEEEEPPDEDDDDGDEDDDGDGDRDGDDEDADGDDADENPGVPTVIPAGSE